MEEIIKITKDKLNRAKDFFQNEIKSVRTGRANAMLVEDIKIEVYGQNMRVKDTASITVPDASSIVVAPWDKSNLKPIEDGLNKANLGVSVVNLGENIRVTLPELSAERREEMKKMVDRKMEEVKINMRNIRREAVDEIKGAEKDKKIGEDQARRLEKEIQKILEDAVAELEKIAENKKGEISR